MTFGDHQPEPEPGKLAVQVLPHRAMAGPRGLEAFVEHRTERRVQREDHRDGCRVVIHA